MMARPSERTVGRSRSRSSWSTRVRTSNHPAQPPSREAAPARARSLNYSRFDAIGSDSDEEGVSKPSVSSQRARAAATARPPPPAAATAAPVGRLGDDLAPSELESLQREIIRNLEPLRAPPPATAPANRLACDFSRQADWSRVHADPPIWTCDSFLSAAECDALIAAARPLLRPSQIGSDDELLARQTAAARSKNARRTSWSCTLQYAQPAAAAVLAKARQLTSGLTQGFFEGCSVTRYTEGQEYTEHHDGTPLVSSSPDNVQFMAQGGQRVGTILIYLNDVARGGATTFPPLDGLEVRPRRGRCLLFFPGHLDGRRDERTLHAARPAVDEKWVCQIWVRAHADPILSLKPPRWPRGCSGYADVLKLVFG